jgi:hypothetical protein
MDNIFSGHAAPCLLARLLLCSPPVLGLKVVTPFACSYHSAKDELIICQKRLLSYNLPEAFVFPPHLLAASRQCMRVAVLALPHISRFHMDELSRISRCSRCPSWARFFFYERTNILAALYRYSLSSIRNQQSPCATCCLCRAFLWPRTVWLFVTDTLCAQFGLPC